MISCNPSFVQDASVVKAALTALSGCVAGCPASQERIFLRGSARAGEALTSAALTMGGEAVSVDRTGASGTAGDETEASGRAAEEASASRIDAGKEAAGGTAAGGTAAGGTAFGRTVAGAEVSLVRMLGMRGTDVVARALHCVRCCAHHCSLAQSRVSGFHVTVFTGERVVGEDAGGWRMRGQEVEH